MTPTQIAPHGPIYCDTAHMWLGIHEPMNTFTNAAILIAAYFAYRHVKKSQVGFSADLVILILLLAACGIGSTLWHGLRTMWALQLDWMPGVAFLLVFAALWFRQLFGWAAGIGGAVLMFVAAIASVVFTWRFFDALPGLSPNVRFTPAFATITVFGLAMVTATARRYGRDSVVLGAAILACALAAAVFRSIDLYTCRVIPFGTHFLWHILLSTSSFLGIVLLVRMKKARIANSE